MHSSGMATDTRLGTTIKRARERMRMTQRQLAQALSVNIKTVDNWENNRTSPKNSIGAIEEILGISLTGEAPERVQVITPADEWERLVLSDQTLPVDERRDIVLRSRRLRAALYPLLEPLRENAREHPPQSAAG